MVNYLTLTHALKSKEKNFQVLWDEKFAKALAKKNASKILALLGEIHDFLQQQKIIISAFINFFINKSNGFANIFSDHDQKNCKECPKYKEVFILLWQQSTFESKLEIAKNIKEFYYTIEVEKKNKVTNAYCTVLQWLNESSSFDSHFVIFLTTELLNEYYKRNEDKEILDDEDYEPLNTSLKKFFEEYDKNINLKQSWQRIGVSSINTFTNKYTDLSKQSPEEIEAENEAKANYAIALLHNIINNSSNEKSISINSNPILKLFYNTYFPLSSIIFQKIIKAFEKNSSILKLLYPLLSFEQKIDVAAELRKFHFEEFQFPTTNADHENQLIDLILFKIVYFGFDFTLLPAQNATSVSTQLFQVISNYHNIQTYPKNAKETLTSLYQIAQKYIKLTEKSTPSYIIATSISTTSMMNYPSNEVDLEAIMCQEILALTDPNPRPSNTHTYQPLIS